MDDPRFDMSRDPRFKRAPKAVRRVQVDKRFSHMFTDKQFVETPKVDKRGQRLRANTGRSRLEEFYALTSDGGADAAASAPSTKGAKRRAGRRAAPEKEEEEDDDDDAEEAGAAEDAEESDEASNAGGAEDEDDAEEDSDDDEEEEEEEAEEDAPVDSTVWEADDADVERGDASKRLVLMGCDWDRICAADLLVMLRTYLNSKEGRKGLPGKQGSVEQVSIYPSDYGLAKMEEEAQRGPGAALAAAAAGGPGAVAAAASAADEDEDNEAARAAQTEAIRRYQRERTKYYYAVAECDSAATAAYLYDQMDGLEADGVAHGMLDLRFAPDDLEFPHAPTSQAKEVPKRYQAPTMAGKTSAGHTKAECSWDEAPVQRKRDLMKKRFTPNELRDADLEEYLASTTDEEDDDDNEKERSAEALRSLVGRTSDDEDNAFGSDGSDDGENGDQVMGDMEATFSISASRIEDEVAARAKEQGGKVHTLGSKTKEEEDKTPWEKFLAKKKEKRKERRAAAKDARKAARKRQDGEGEGDEDGDGDDDADAKPAGGGRPSDEATEAELRLLAGEEGAEKGFNLRGKKRGPGGNASTRKASGTGEFSVDVNDPRIASVFSSADFEIDPTNPEFRNSAGMQAVLKRKRTRKVAKPAPAAASAAASAAPAQTPKASSSSAAAAAAAPAAAFGGVQLFAQRRPAPAASAPASSAAAAAAPATAATGEAPAKKKRKRQA